MHRMSQSIRAARVTTKRPALKLHEPCTVPMNCTEWRINGHVARFILWTTEEWERLVEHPPDAQAFPCGFYGALRIE